MIEYTVEQLYHFQCSRCSRWWSIGDYDLIATGGMVCPHCAHDAIPQEKENTDTLIN